MTVRRLVALSLALWLAGVGCLLGCETDAAAAPAAVEQQPLAPRADSCHAFAGHGCCHKSAPAGTATSLQMDDAGASFQTETPQPTGHNVCPLAGQTADAARKVRHVDADAPGVNAALPDAPDARTHARLAARHLRVPDRGGTHLRCCVLLI
jgi:hypothetical protein